MDHSDKIGIVDFGGQYAHLIASRIRRLGAYTEILSNEESIERYREFKGIILSGGPESVYEKNSPSISDKILELGVPILGICYGHQLLMKLTGAKVEPSESREYGLAFLNLEITPNNYFVKNLSNKEKVWMSHGDEVVSLPEGFIAFGNTDNCRYAGVFSPERKIYSIQFHPEVTHSEHGETFLFNFISICGILGSWDINKFLNEKIIELQKEINPNKKVFLLVSGGVDSTVAYLLLARALGKDRVKGLFIDTGFLRKDEASHLRQKLHSIGFDLHFEDASEIFYNELKSIHEPEQKRKIIGELFLKVKNNYAEKISLNPDEWILGQGTIYPDTIESGGTKYSHTIKTHHNRVQGILDLMEKGNLIEPLKELYKDEVRELGKILGLDEEMVNRHPFPGPGLAVRMIASKEYHPPVISSLINWLDEFHNAKSIILPVKSVGVQGDQRSYKSCAVLNDFTEDWHTLEICSTKITNQIREINRVVFVPFQELPEKYFFEQVNLDRIHGDVLREVDDRVNQIIHKNLLNYKIWQMPVVLVPVSSSRGKFGIVLRPVESREAMTANFYKMRRGILKEIINSILEISNIGTVFYDLTSKPPGTIEWE